MVCQFVVTGLNYAQTSEVIRELAMERAKEKKPAPKIVERNEPKKKEKAKIKKLLIKAKQPENKDAQASRKPSVIPEGPRATQESGDLDKELADWLGKLKTIESVLP